MRMKVDHDLEFTGACILENVPVNVERLTRWLLWVLSVTE